MGDNTLKLSAAKVKKRALGHPDYDVAGVASGGKGVDAGFIFKNIHRRHGQAAGKRHLLHHVEQAPFVGVGALRGHQHAIEAFSHFAAAGIGRNRGKERQ